MKILRHLDLFSGIGGFTLAAKWVGIQTDQFVEIDPYCQRILAKNFPGVPIHGDIATFTATQGQFDVITGGFPCQDISRANPNGRGLEGERSGLFHELMRIVRQCRPRYVVLENVAALLSKHGGRDMGTVLWELSESGYDAEWQVISAASVGAPHLRERVFIIAYADGKRHIQSQTRGSIYNQDWHNPPSQQKKREQFYATISSRSTTPHTNRSRREKLNTPTISATPGHTTGGIIKGGDHWEVEPGVGRMADGVPRRVDRIRGLGNAVVPQVATIALRRVLELDTTICPC